MKVGAGVTRDAQYLLQDHRLSVLGTLELGYMASVAECPGIKKSLDFLSVTYLGHSLDKEYSVQCSDWEAYALSDDQIRYAAFDALVAIEVFKVFAEEIEPNSVMNPSRLQRVIFACSTYVGKSDR